MVLLSLLSPCVTAVSNLHHLFCTNCTPSRTFLWLSQVTGSYIIIIIFIFKNFRYGATMWRSKTKTTLIKTFFFSLVYIWCNVFIFTLLSVSFSAMKRELHTNYPLIFGVVGSLKAVTLLALGLYTQKICRRDKYTRERGTRYHRIYESIHSICSYHFLHVTWYIDLRAQGLQTVCFTWRQLEAATNNFDQANKLGEGGFGSVFRVC